MVRGGSSPLGRTGKAPLDERYYGHLERHVLAASAVATEEAIARASTVSVRSLQQ